MKNLKILVSEYFKGLNFKVMIYQIENVHTLFYTVAPRIDSQQQHLNTGDSKE